MSEETTRTSYVQVNNDFAARDAQFKEACEKAGIPASARQAGKYRRGEGLAYQTEQLKS